MFFIHPDIVKEKRTYELIILVTTALKKNVYKREKNETCLWKVFQEDKTDSHCSIAMLKNYESSRKP